MTGQTVEKSLENIRNDEVHGAAFLAREAIRTLIQGIEACSEDNREVLKETFISIALELLQVRPSMPAIGHLVALATEKAQEDYKTIPDTARLRQKWLDDLKEAIENCRRAHEGTVEKASEFLKPNTRVLTLSLSSNVQDTLIRSRDKIKRVLAAESRPSLEGRQLALILSKEGLDVTLITDAAMGQALEEVDLCLVGADGVLQDGSLVNKTGTRLLALAARQAKAPFYSICETFKYHVGAVPFELESRPESAVAEPIQGVEISNQVFEVAPAHLVDGYITELGVIPPHLAREQIRNWQVHLSGKRIFGDWV